MTDDELKEMRIRLDILNGSVIAQTEVIKSLIAVVGSDPRLAILVAGVLERSRTGLLGSSISDACIEGFEHTAAELAAQAGVAQGSSSQAPS